MDDSPNSPNFPTVQYTCILYALVILISTTLSTVYIKTLRRDFIEAVTIITTGFEKTWLPLTIINI